MNEAELKYKAKVMLLMFRCEYIGNDLYKSPLTKKGRGFLSLPPSFWRKYNDVLCYVSKRHSDTVYWILNTLHQQNKIILN